MNNKDNWIMLEITNNDIILAESYAIQQRYAGICIGGKSKFQTTNAILDHKIGHIGQLKFKEWLENNKIEHIYHNDLNGHGDICDFEINGKKIDIKTGHLTWPISMLKSGYRFFITKQQLTKDVDIYLNIQLDHDMKNAYIMGWINKNDTQSYLIMESDNMVNAALGIPLTDLKPIYSLFGDMLNIDIPIITMDNMMNNKMLSHGSCNHTVTLSCGW